MRGTQRKPNRYAAFLFFAALAFGLVVIVAIGSRTQTTPDSDEQQFVPLIHSVEGRDLFRAYCASCHGLDGKGGGPVAPALRPRMPDLTLLAMKNGGEFPAARVRKVIMEDGALASHGSLEMPVWGPVFHQVEEDVDRGNVRLENLVKYLESIQSFQRAGSNGKGSSNH